MKTLFYRFMALLVAVTMIVGCETDPVTPNDEAQPQTIMVAALSGDYDTKVGVTSNDGDALGFKVNWEVGDKLIASSEDGDTYVATFEIKKASDIAANGSARFTAVDASKTLTVLTKYKFYTRDRYESSDLSYNEKMTYPDSEWWSDVDDENFNVNATLYTPEPVRFDISAITLEHFYSYIELTAELPSRDYDVRIRYHDVDTSTDYSYRYMTSGTSYGGTSSTFVFNAAIAPANLSASNPIIVDCSDGSEENYTELFRIESDGAFEAGKHYRIKNESGLFLADMGYDNVPEGNTWTVLDTDATAGRGKFYGLSSALGRKAEGESINVVFPNLTTFPEEAIYEEWITADITFSSESVTTVEHRAFGLNEGIVSVNLPNATIINGNPFENASDLTSVTIAKSARIQNNQTTLFEDVDLSKVDLTTHSSNVANDVYLLLADGTTKVGPFKSVNGVTPKPLMLADIDENNIPVGDTWTIEDTDATADDSSDYNGLGKAIRKLEASRSVDIVMPNITVLPEYALSSISSPEAKWTFSAPEVKTVGNAIFYATNNITKIDLPKATSLGRSLCNTGDLVSLTIAKYERAIATDYNLFFGMETENIDLTTHESNVNGLAFKLVWDFVLLSDNFKSVNGNTTLVGFPDDAVSVVKAKLGIITSTTEIPAEGRLIRQDNKDNLGDMIFFIGYNKRRVGKVYAYSTFEDVTWTSDDNYYSPYFKLNGQDDGTLKLELLKELPATLKTITITATAPNGATKSFKINLQSAITPTSVELDRDLFVANKDAVMSLGATVLPADATNKTLTWTSSDTSVATVDTNGKVTTIDEGEAIITATAQDGGKKATCTVRVNAEDYVEPQFKIGDYYPNADYPIGVVFMVEGAHSTTSYGTKGKIISLDEFYGSFSTVDDQSVETFDNDGYENMRRFYQTDSDFSNYPAFKWVAEKNAVGYNYPSGAKDQWYLPGDKELRYLLSGMCGYIMGYGLADWGRYQAMNFNGANYTPDITAFNQIITAEGGTAISSSGIISSTITNNMVFSLTPSTGRVGEVRKTYECRVRAVMEFDVTAEQY